MKAITANHLFKGTVLFFATGGGWSDTILDAALFSDEAAFDAALSQAKAQEADGLVIGVYDLEVSVEGDMPTPLKLRERIRVDGPTTAYGDAMKFDSFYAA